MDSHCCLDSHAKGRNHLCWRIYHDFIFEAPYILTIFLICLGLYMLLLPVLIATQLVRLSLAEIGEAGLVRPAFCSLSPPPEKFVSSEFLLRLFPNVIILSLPPHIPPQKKNPPVIILSVASHIGHRIEGGGAAPDSAPGFRFFLFSILKTGATSPWPIHHSVIAMLLRQSVVVPVVPETYTVEKSLKKSM